jgi:hypothetical protein
MVLFNVKDMTWIETKINEVETTEEKRKNLTLETPLTPDGDRGLKDLYSELPNKNWVMYTPSDIQDAAWRRIDKIIANKLISIKNLSDDEKKKMGEYMNTIKESMNEKGSISEKIEHFSQIRDWLVGTLSASDGKSQKDKWNLEESQKTQKENIESTIDWKESLRKIQELMQRGQEEQRKKSDLQRKIAEEEWNRSSGIANMNVWKEAIDTCLRDYP